MLWSCWPLWTKDDNSEAELNFVVVSYHQTTERGRERAASVLVIIRWSAGLETSACWTKLGWETLPTPPPPLTWTISAMFIKPEPGEGYSGGLSSASPCKLFECCHQGGGGGPSPTDIWDHLFRQLLVSKQAVDLVAISAKRRTDVSYSVFLAVWSPQPPVTCMCWLCWLPLQTKLASQGQ